MAIHLLTARQVQAARASTYRTCATSGSGWLRSTAAWTGESLTVGTAGAGQTILKMIGEVLTEAELEKRLVELESRVSGTGGGCSNRGHTDHQCQDPFRGRSLVNRNIDAQPRARSRPLHAYGLQYARGSAARRRLIASVGPTRCADSALR